MGYSINGAYSGGLRKIYDKSNKFDNSLIYFIFKDEAIISTIHKYATGSILLHASGSISHLQIVFSEKHFLEFQKVAKPLYQKMVANQKQTQTLIALRDYLLPLLMSGQIRVDSDT